VRRTALAPMLSAVARGVGVVLALAISGGSDREELVEFSAP
jgi:hypothetical protein